jgi:hypothetical protein
MESLDLSAESIASLKAYPPHEAILDFRMSGGNSVRIHIQPKDIHRLLELVEYTAGLFPPPEGVQ